MIILNSVKVQFGRKLCRKPTLIVHLIIQSIAHVVHSIALPESDETRHQVEFIKYDYRITYFQSTRLPIQRVPARRPRRRYWYRWRYIRHSATVRLRHNHAAWDSSMTLPVSEWKIERQQGASSSTASTIRCTASWKTPSPIQTSTLMTSIIFTPSRSIAAYTYHNDSTD